MSASTGQPRQFNIGQLLVLTALICLVLAASLHFEWLYIPSLMWDYYKESPLQRKMVITVGVALLPTFIMGVLGWLVFRVPYLITSHRQSKKQRQDRLEQLRQEMLARKSDTLKSPVD